jgi:hypothetical protein
VCVLWDLSEGGARLAVAHPEELPDEVTITLGRDVPVVAGTTCRVVWRSKEQIGLEFVGNADPIRQLIKQMAETPETDSSNEPRRKRGQRHLAIRTSAAVQSTSMTVWKL